MNTWSEFLIRIIVPGTLIGLVLWGLNALRRRENRNVVDEAPPGHPYAVFTTQYDLTLRGDEVPIRLPAESLDAKRGWAMLGDYDWRESVSRARAISAGLTKMGTVGAALSARFSKRDWSDWAICLLVDQSGSMRGDPIEHVGASIKWLAEALRTTRANVAVMGFSTVGWHGGKAYRDWKNSRSRWPGRVCALLHIEYQRFGENMSEASWEAMLHPDILRENIDGEAILWSSELLKAQAQRNKLLIVVSDGAAVDDATLKLNGQNILESHLLSVIEQVEKSDEISLAAVGINHRVDRYYKRSCVVFDLTELPDALCGVIVETVENSLQI